MADELIDVYHVFKNGLGEIRMVHYRCRETAKSYIVVDRPDGGISTRLSKDEYGLFTDREAALRSAIERSQNLAAEYAAKAEKLGRDSWKWREELERLVMEPAGDST